MRTSPDADWTHRTEAAEAGRLARAGEHGAAGKILAALERAAPDSKELLELRGGLTLLAARPLAAMRAFGAAQQRTPAAVLARKLALAQWRAGQRAASQVTLEGWLARVPDDLRPEELRRPTCRRIAPRSGDLVRFRIRRLLEG